EYYFGYARAELDAAAVSHPCIPYRIQHGVTAMADQNPIATDRRAFLPVPPVATASAVSLGSAADALGEAADDAAKPLSIPRRALGKTGIDITILNAGTGRGQGIQRILKFAYAQGIRCFDTSEKYQPE